MTRKHFTDLAHTAFEFSEEQCPSLTGAQVDRLFLKLTVSLAEFCSRHNDHFNVDRFVDACYGKGYDITKR